MTFTRDITKFVKNTEIRLAAAVVKSVYEMSSQIIKATPIDLPFGWHDPESVGYARGGWNVSFDGPNRRLTGRLDPSGEETIAAVRRALSGYRIRTHSSIHINNSVSYVPILEFGGYQNFVTRLKSTDAGYSSQAPVGMVRVTTFMWPTFVNKAVATARFIG